ncbi:MAG: A/G-specific adenine glycosylase [Magnetococcales bacterium]|nr:A/G-specific adenine glycosylase [Magnetococcales bacterium]
MTSRPLSPKRLAKALLAFYDREGRSLPWREMGVGNLYPIWLSEVMLQQTGVETVIPYFHRFLDRFPDLQSLARADTETVLSLWQGLGYYQRGRNLHRAARLVVEEMGGRIPHTREGLLKLPGIGPNTAAAILAIGLNQPEAILDGNVKRVVARMIALDQPVSSKEGLARLWQAARAWTPANRPGDYAQGIMDLGATLCTPRDPHCPRCPWQADCLGYRQGNPQAYPVANPKKKAQPKKIQVTLLVRRGDGCLLLVERPAKGLLGGMWEPPGGEMGEPLSGRSSDPRSGQSSVWLQQQAEVLVQGLGLQVDRLGALPSVRHVFTHFQLTVYPFQSLYLGGTPRFQGERNHCWADSETLTCLPISTLHRKVLAHWSDGSP